MKAVFIWLGKVSMVFFSKRYQNRYVLKLFQDSITTKIKYTRSNTGY